MMPRTLTIIDDQIHNDDSPTYNSNTIIDISNSTIIAATISNLSIANDGSLVVLRQSQQQQQQQPRQASLYQHQQQQRRLQKEPLGEHPHAGAKDPTGTYWGYVHDPTILRNNNPNWDFTINNTTTEEKKLLCAPVGYGPERANFSSWRKHNIGISTSKGIFEDIIRVVGGTINDDSNNNNNNNNDDDDEDNNDPMAAKRQRRAEKRKQKWG